MQGRSWLNRLHPQTLLSATMLLYIEGLFNLVRGPFLAMVGAAMFPAAWDWPTTVAGAGVWA